MRGAVCRMPRPITWILDEPRGGLNQRFGTRRHLLLMFVATFPASRKGTVAMSMTSATVPQATEDTAFVRFWNDVLAPKFIRFKHILVDGLSRHSEAVFPA